jgi:hypothetical protein
MLQRCLILTFVFAISVYSRHVQAQDDFSNDDQNDQSDNYDNQRINPRDSLRRPTARCDNLNANIAAPRIEINQQNKSRVTGTIEGVCIVDAAFYEESGNKQSISVSTMPQYKSFEFSISLRPGKGGKIRVHNSHGDDAEYEIESQQVDNSNDPLGIGVNPSGEEDTTVEPTDR